ncbi:MAG TPA: hypothetical protein VFA85_06900 [Terriglobales bacterium]|nr:hypothetical protein [Terriglobales bacterium]
MLDGVLDGVELEGVELEGAELLHWSATLVALVTLNSCAAPVPELAVAVPPEAVALAFGPEAVAVAPWPEVEESVELVPEVPDALIELAALEPVTWTSLPIIVRTASRLPVRR